jgi:hypothetical protein
LLAIGVALVQQQRSTTELASLRAQVATLREAERTSAPVVHEVRTPSAASVASPGAAASVEPEAPVPPTQVDERAVDPEVALFERQERDRARLESTITLYAEAYAAEGADEQWSGEAARALQGTYSTEEFAKLSVTVDCRTTMCRVDFSSSDDVAGLESYQRIVSTPAPWRGTRFVHFDKASGRGFSYVPRQGFTLPEPAPDPAQGT